MVLKARLSPAVSLLLAAIASLPWSRTAGAEPSPAERAIAQRLFDQAKEQLRADQVGAACESFAESQRLDPATGTRLNLAACHEREGKLASAWVEFRECLPAIRGEARSDRLRFALDHLAAIEPRLAYLTLEVPDVPGAPDREIRLDGHDLGRAAWGVPIPVDEGSHEAQAQEAEGRVWRAIIRVRNGERKAVAVPPRGGGAGEIRADVALPVRASPPSHGATHAATRPRAQEGPPAGLSPTRTAAAIVMGGLGVAAFGVATYAAFHAETLWRDRNQACRNDVCSPEGLRLGERASTSAEIATWSLAGGVAALGAGALLWLWTPDARQEADGRAVRSVVATPLPDGGSLQLGGVF